jgi:hypothetical protein
MRAARSPTAGIWLAEPVVPLDADARAPPGRELVVVLLVGKLRFRRDVGIVEHLVRMAGRRQPDRAVRLLDRPRLIGIPGETSWCGKSPSTANDGISHGPA